MKNEDDRLNFSIAAQQLTSKYHGKGNLLANPNACRQYTTNVVARMSSIPVLGPQMSIAEERSSKASSRLSPKGSSVKDYQGALGSSLRVAST